jgi:hypothetical protein
MNQRGSLLMEALVAGALLLLVSAALAAVLIATSQISVAAQSVTKARLLAQSHLAQVRVSGEASSIHQDLLTSIATIVEHEGRHYWQIEVAGPNLPRPLRLVAAP